MSVLHGNGDEEKQRDSERTQDGKKRLSLDLATVDALLPDATLTSRTLKRLGLDEDQTKAVNDEIVSAQKKFQEIEKVHSKVQTDANGDQFVAIEPHATEIQELVEQIAVSLKSTMPDERASILARMIGRNYGGDEWSGVLRREVYFSQPDDPVRAAEGRIIEKAFDGDSLVDTDYFSVEHGESRWGHLLDFGAKK